MATRVTPADGYGERDAALLMAETIPRGRITLGMDRAYDVADFVATLRQMDVTPTSSVNVGANSSSRPLAG